MNYFFEFFEKLPKLPGKEDVKGAAEALLRLQDTYNLSTSEMANGNIKALQRPHRSTVIG